MRAGLCARVQACSLGPAVLYLVDAGLAAQKGQGQEQATEAAGLAERIAPFDRLGADDFPALALHLGDALLHRFRALVKRYLGFVLDHRSPLDTRE